MAFIDPRLLDALASAHQRTLSTVQTASDAASIDSWLAFDSFGDEDAWTDLWWALLLPAATVASMATFTYMQNMNRYVAVGPALRRPSMAWASTMFDNIAFQPVVRARKLVSEGVDPQQAILDASATVRDMSTTMIRQAEQEAFADIIESMEFNVSFTYEEEYPDGTSYGTVDIDELDERVAQLQKDGYRLTQRDKSPLMFKRIISAGACGFCRVLAGKLYSAKARDRHPTGQYHRSCHCTWREVTVAEARLWDDPMSGGAWRDVIDDRNNPQAYEASQLP